MLTFYASRDTLRLYDFNRRAATEPTAEFHHFLSIHSGLRGGAKPLKSIHFFFLLFLLALFVVVLLPKPTAPVRAERLAPIFNFQCNFT